MGWPTDSTKLTNTDNVTVRRAGTWTQDSSGGRVRNLGAVEGPFLCTFSPVSSTRNADVPINYRESPFSIYVVSFTDANPNLHFDDELNWLEERKILTVIATEISGPPEARIWNIRAKEAPAR